MASNPARSVLRIQQLRIREPAATVPLFAFVA
jgi:hypothetical protein